MSFDKKKKTATLSYGPTVSLGGIYFKTNVSLTIEDFEMDDMPKAQAIMKEMYMRSLASELKLGKALEGKPLKEVCNMLAEKLNKIDDARNSKSED